MVNQSYPTSTVCRWFWLRVGICIAMLYTPQQQNVLISPPFNPGRYGGGKARNFWEIFHPTTWNIDPPTCFLGFQKRWGGVLRMSDFSPGLSRFSETESYCCNGISGVVASRAVKYNGPWFCTSPPQKVLNQSLGRGKKHGYIRFSWFARTWPHPPVPAVA